MVLTDTPLIHKHILEIDKKLHRRSHWLPLSLTLSALLLLCIINTLTALPQTNRATSQSNPDLYKAGSNNIEIELTCRYPFRRPSKVEPAGKCNRGHDSDIESSKKHEIYTTKVQRFRRSVCKHTGDHHDVTTSDLHQPGADPQRTGEDHHRTTDCHRAGAVQKRRESPPTRSRETRDRNNTSPNRRGSPPSNNRSPPSKR